jgi:DNA-binding NarL/FixJ family response regulator
MSVSKANGSKPALNGNRYHHRGGIGNANTVNDMRQDSNARSDRSQAKTSRKHQKPVLIYIDAHELTRCCIGLSLQNGLSEFSVDVLSDPEQIVTAPIIGEHVRVVLINVGSVRSSSSLVAGLTARVAQLLPDVPIVMLSHHEDVDNIHDSFELGLRGYIPTSMTSLVVIEAIRLVCAGGTFLPTHVLGLRACAGAHGTRLLKGFTQRQVQVLGCLRRGMANKSIASELKIDQTTVKSHIQTIMKKLNAANRTQAVYLTRDLFDHVL